MKKKILHNFLRLFSLGFFLFLYADANSQSVEISTSPSTSQNIVTGNSGYHVGEIIYSETEVGAANFITAGTAINHIEFSVNAPGTPTSFGNFSVYLKNIPSTTNTFAAGTYDKTGYTQVYTGTVDLTAAGWFGIDLTTTFVRTAGSNLQVMFERLDGISRTVPVTYDATVGITNATRRLNATAAPVVGTTQLTGLSAFRPFIRFAHVNATDASIASFIQPASSCFTSPQSIGVVVNNEGTSTTIAAGAASVALTISGANSYTTTLTNTTAISPGGNETMNFSGINLPNAGANLIQAVVTFAGDGSATNDTLRTVLTTTTTITTFPAIEGAENTPLDYFSYVKTLSGVNAWGLQTGKLDNVATTTPTTDSLAPHGGNKFYLFDSYNIVNSDAILHSNCFSLPPSGTSNNYYVSFWMSHDTAYSTAPNIFLDSIYLVISTDKGVTWTRLQGYQRNNPQFAIPGWMNHQVDIPNYAGQTVQIGFEGVSQYGNFIGIDDITIVAENGLPVTLLSFTGERVGATNQLMWSTASETNNIGFELQRSADGTNYTKLSFVATKSEGGNSNRNLKYDFNDNKPFATSNYYRLKQIDKDGKFTYSNIVLVKGTKAATLSIASIYPNPTVNNLRLAIASPNNEKVTLVVTDLAGRVVMQNATQLVAGDNNLQLNVKGLAKGSYSIKVVCNNGCNSSAERFVKQ